MNKIKELELSFERNPIELRYISQFYDESMYFSVARKSMPGRPTSPTTLKREKEKSNLAKKKQSFSVYVNKINEWQLFFPTIKGASVIIYFEKKFLILF